MSRSRKKKTTRIVAIVVAVCLVVAGVLLVRSLWFSQEVPPDSSASAIAGDSNPSTTSPSPSSGSDSDSGTPGGENPATPTTPGSTPAAPPTTPSIGIPGVSHTEALDMTVSVIDIGQGDSILIQSEGESLLVDAGNNGWGDEVVA